MCKLRCGIIIIMYNNIEISTIVLHYSIIINVMYMHNVINSDIIIQYCAKQGRHLPF